jgi:hypothetical protein
VVSKVFVRLPQSEALVYQNDVLAHSTDFHTHWGTLQKVYSSLRDRDLTFKLKKTQLSMEKASFLGHVVEAQGRYPSPEKIKAIMEKAYPRKDATEVRCFIGMTLYYRNCIHDYAAKIAPLHALTRQEIVVPDVWGPGRWTC